ncbi:diguanylate cyclase [Rhizobium sp. L1K21]|uniref:GGDEF domain-containing protein n=1 Tax=Rhizobium sp. L1K21 TaxID=2954933 RepID=UPI002093CBD9|nr:GGDEF domain-containing protein [Rhizobium sp. L1K21]MCO6185868.1 GGDEF domain-containing protein [Rhizobium sp. L1K21]
MYQNALLIIFECIVYFAAMAALLHFRRKLGLGVFICVLGVFHFLETYLAANLELELLFGLAAVGSVPFFAGKLMMLLALYLEEDASVVRQPIYGLLIGNFLVVGVAALLRLHLVVGESQVDFSFLDQMGALMVWGTLLLYIDALGIILLYEKLRAMGIGVRMLRIFIAGSVMLAFDQLGFFALLKWLYDVGPEVFWGGLVAKIFCAGIYALMLGVFFHSKVRFRLKKPPQGVGDVFQDLTFRERYESLLEHSGLDGLTGALNRDRLDTDLPRFFDAVEKSGESACVAIIDIDYFKQVNDRHGHLAGDEVLKTFAAFFVDRERNDNLRFYRYGGEEFVLVTRGYRRGTAHNRLDALRLELAEAVRAPDGKPVTFSAGVAEYGVDGHDAVSLLKVADMRLYTAKSTGRNRVC